MGKLLIPRKVAILFPFLFLAMVGTSFAGKDQYISFGIYSGLSSGSGDNFGSANHGRTGDDYHTGNPVLGCHLSIDVAPKFALQLDLTHQMIKNNWYFHDWYNSEKGTARGSINFLILSSVFASNPLRPVIFFFQIGGGLAVPSVNSKSNIELGPTNLCFQTGTGIKINLTPKHPLVHFNIAGALTMRPGSKSYNIDEYYIRLLTGIEFRLKANQPKRGPYHPPAI